MVPEILNKYKRPHLSTPIQSLGEERLHSVSKKNNSTRPVCRKDLYFSGLMINLLIYLGCTEGLSDLLSESNRAVLDRVERIAEGIYGKRNRIYDINIPPDRVRVYQKNIFLVFLIATLGRDGRRFQQNACVRR